MTPIGLAVAWMLLAQADHVPLASKVRVGLSVDEQTFYPRAPISFRVDVYNRTDARMTVGLVLKPAESKYVTLLYRRLPAEFRPLTYTPEWDIPAPVPPDFSYLTLEPHRHRSVSFSLAADPGRAAFIFDEPGDYEIKMICHVVWYQPVDTLETPPVRIRVEPAPPSEAAAIEDWDVDLAIFAQNDGSYSSGAPFVRTVKRALRFMEAHPDSLYSDLLRERSLETLEHLRRRGKELTDFERYWYDRLRRKAVP